MFMQKIKRAIHLYTEVSIRLVQIFLTSIFIFLLIITQACYGGNIDIVKYLYEKGIDINVRTKDGFTPIYAGSNI